jgi:hypothetical protein
MLYRALAPIERMVGSAPGTATRKLNREDETADARTEVAMPFLSCESLSQKPPLDGVPNR